MDFRQVYKPLFKGNCDLRTTGAVDKRDRSIPQMAEMLEHSYALGGGEKRQTVPGMHVVGIGGLAEPPDSLAPFHGHVGTAGAHGAEGELRWRVSFLRCEAVTPNGLLRTVVDHNAQTK